MKRLISVAIVAIWFAGCTAAPPLSSETNTLIKQAEVGNVNAIHKLCYGYLRGKDAPKNYDEAFKWCTKGAGKNVSSSQTLLAEIYYLGLGIIKDHKKALYWYQMAANNNHAHAQYVLALMYLEEQSINSQKPVEAIMWLKRSAAKGHKKAQQKLKELEGKHSAGTKQ